MRIALGVEYIGTPYFGWQAQENLLTVQGCLQTALSKIAGSPIEVYCAGRTDAGVHAEEQVVHFDTDALRIERAWVLGTNTYLPATIAVKWMREVDENFHARFSAISRRYRYVIYNDSVRSALHATQTTWFHYPLDVEKMQLGAQFLLGELDFTSFRSSACESKTPNRFVHFIHVHRQGKFVTIDIKANAFLHHMVRNIAGILMRVGAGFQPPEWVNEVLLAKDRRHAANTAAPNGLFLTQVEYPAPYHFPPD